MLPFMEVKRPFSDEDWNNTPEPVKAYIIHLEQLIKQMLKRQDELEKRTENLEAQSKMNSQNSSKPPSSDSPFKRPKKEKKQRNRKRGAQKGHKGHRQQMLEPKITKNIFPETCSCGHSGWESGSVTPFYTHQHIELPKIELNVKHLVLHKGTCACCGKTVKAAVPGEFASGYGPRLSSVICELSGSHGASRQTVQDFCHSVLGLSISTGGIQRVIDRMSNARRAWHILSEKPKVWPSEKTIRSDSSVNRF